MKKHILLISNPGEKGAVNYCNGVNVDIEKYYDYFTSPLGGAWYPNEITHLDRATVSGLKFTLSNMKDNDYLKIIFCGHGFYSARRTSTILELRTKEEIDSIELRGIAAKQTIIIDCCREIHPDILLEEERLAKFAKSFSDLNKKDCRLLYETSIAKCAPGMIVTYGCNINEVAGDSSSQGGYFSSSLLKVCKNIHESSNVDIKTQYHVDSIVNVFNNAVPLVQKLSGNTQNPQIEKPRSEPYYPFAIIA